MTAQQQPTPPSVIPHSTSPLPQASGSSPPQTSLHAQPQNSNLQTAESAHRESIEPQSSDYEAAQSAQPQSSASVEPQSSDYEPTQSTQSIPPTSESEAERVQPKRGRQSNHYWFVNVIGKICF